MRGRAELRRMKIRMKRQSKWFMKRQRKSQRRGRIRCRCRGELELVDR